MLKRITYYLFWIFINIFRFVPFAVLYLFSDFLYFIMQYVISYRKSVIVQNLEYCFPEKSKKEINEIRREFYKRLCDILLESLKGYTLSREELIKRFGSVDHQITYAHFEQAKDIFILTGHLGNWEWGNASIINVLKHQSAVLYKPMSNPFIENYVKKSRGRFGADMLSIYSSMRYFIIKKERPVAYFLVADQYPTTKEKEKRVNFFGNITPFLHGPENFSKQLKTPVYYLSIERVKRGYYSMKFTKLTDDASTLADTELTQLYASHLEETIRKQPADWMWSHKRWKKILYAFD